ncbi:MAG: DUF882 domain-containing protein [Kofleriaceae bacterium]
MPGLSLLPLIATSWLSAGQNHVAPDTLTAALGAVEQVQADVRAKRVEIHLVDANHGDRYTFHIAPDGTVDDPTRAAIEEAFRCRRTLKQHEIDQGLLAMLADVSARYPGKTIEFVSVFRAKDERESRHRQGRAFDFRIPGVSLTEVRDYVWTHHHEVGVGWYPKSGFIHMDHRAGDPDYAWTDAGHGERGNPYWATAARSGRAEPSRDDRTGS